LLVEFVVASGYSPVLYRQGHARELQYHYHFPTEKSITHPSRAQVWAGLDFRLFE